MIIAAISGVTFVVVLAGGILGLALRRVLPEHHLIHESGDVIKLGAGLIATMTALLLSVQLDSAKTSFDVTDDEIKQIAGKVGHMDRVLNLYGDESRPVRELLRATVAGSIQQIWPPSDKEIGQLNPHGAGGDTIYQKLHALAPDTAEKSALKAEALSLAAEIARLRWLVYAQSLPSGSWLFLGAVVVWLFLVFTSFGLFGKPNATVIVTLVVCAMSVSAAIGLILELNTPFHGLIHVSSEPLRAAVSVIGT